MMDIASINMPEMTLRIKIVRSRGYRIRMALLSAVLWAAGKVAPSNIDVQTEIKLRD
jgi:hypothetical protein